MKLQCLLVDDEPPALEVLESYVREVDHLHLVGTCGNALEAFGVLQQQAVDLLFLDIKMPKMLGTDFLRSLRHPPQVIFTTAYREYAYEDFELDAVDYLLKPISLDRFLKAVAKASATDAPPAAPPDPAPSHNPDAFLYFRIDRKMVKVVLRDILYIKGLKDCIKIHPAAGPPLVVKQTINGMEEKLSESNFLRIHRSFIVALDKIRTYSARHIEVANQELPIGRLFRARGGAPWKCRYFCGHPHPPCFPPMPTHTISPAQPLTLAALAALLADGRPVALGEDARQRIGACHEYLHRRLARHDQPIYGINTGFGSLYNVSIAPEARAQLQVNLMMSHACGTGAEVPQNLVRLMLFLKAQSLSYGHSGVQTATAERLVAMYNRELLPVVYEQGSLGASGDLAPLAHLCLPLLGLGEVNYQGYRLKAADAMSLFSWAPLKLQAKEGLALLNGTQFMLAYAVDGVLRAQRLAAAADVIGALSTEAFGGCADPFDENLHRIRPHAGQGLVARRLRVLLAGSGLQTQPRRAVQDPYSFRCQPQVHGASRDALAYVAQVVETECNSVTDNPNIFPDEDLILSGGNFHGQPLALALDHLVLAVAELGSISERRTYQLISGQRGLPQYLVAEPGLNSGLMIPQYTAAGIVSQNKQLCTPASVDSIVSSNGQEDHVSMGANAATKARRVVENVEQVLGIELLTAVQALAFRRPARTSEALERVVAAFGQEVKFVGQDRVLYPDLHKAAAFVRRFDWQ